MNFDRSELIAWQSAAALKGVLVQLQGEHAGQVRLLAHSQGNVVSGEAIHQGTSGLVHTYVASQAALSAGFLGLEPFYPALAQITLKTPDIIAKYPESTTGRPYLEDVKTKAGTLFNYFNLSDYALTGNNLFQPTWEYNNLTRPDNSDGYGYQGELENYPPAPPNVGFYHDSIPLFGSRRTLQLPGDAYEVFSSCAQSRTRALGAVNRTAEVVRDSLDLFSFEYDSKRYSHSRQFRSNVIDEQGYWRHFVIDMDTNRTW